MIRLSAAKARCSQSRTFRPVAVGEAALGEGDGRVPARSLRDLRGEPRRGKHRVLRQLFGVGVAHLIAHHDAHTHAEIDMRARAVDLAVGKGDRGAAGVLEVEVGVVGAARKSGLQHALTECIVDAELREVGQGGSEGAEGSAGGGGGKRPSARCSAKVGAATLAATGRFKAWGIPLKT
jgi:hypothetical protein